MQKFKGILLATDLDGTLLKDDKSVSKENIEAIEYFKSEGGLFTFITGRIPIAFEFVADEVKPNVPCGCGNGSFIYDFSKKEFLWTATLADTYMELIEYVQKNFPEVGIEITTKDKIYFIKKNSATEKHKKDEKLPDLLFNGATIDEPFSKILFAKEKEEVLLKLIESIKNHPLHNDFDFIRSDSMYYEVLPKGVSKGNILLKLIDILGVDKNKTITVGDNDNDSTMIKNAKIGIAVSNASPYAKECADYITVSNEEDAIAKIIHDLDNGKIKI
ncbi:MAG: HAD family phosphatase [Ruminococcaceae bacterium]|nr:HAD family phosphatase [Oscillospiraceae bacterium]